jgi:tetratricopeptide (TPR) repeat protein
MSEGRSLPGEGAKKSVTAQHPHPTAELENKPNRRVSVWAAMALVICLALALRAQRLLAALYVNLGAARQAQAELALYDAERADDPTLDEVRRQVDLSRAEHYYERTLALDPGHAQARVQLAQLALSRGQYARALDHAQVAWEADPDDWRTRLTLGDALVAEGNVVEGVELVRGLPFVERRLECWAWYRHWITGEYRQAADAWKAIVLMNPENTRAADMAQLAEQKARTQ